MLPSLYPIFTIIESNGGATTSFQLIDGVEVLEPIDVEVVQPIDVELLNPVDVEVIEPIDVEVD